MTSIDPDQRLGEKEAPVNSYIIGYPSENHKQFNFTLVMQIP